MKSVHPFVNACDISIDAATKDTYENKTRIRGNWDVLMERLDFIINIPTISHYRFSFVSQDCNYKEMYQFYELIKNLNWKSDKKFEVFFNHILNWNTFSDEEYISKDISNPNHELHSDFLLELYKIHNQKNVSHNFNHLLEKKINLI
jgi:MoaA/NifB/PqqE/SkfB family radical SAM enzyme